jgi:hypothetical protein
MFPVNRELLSSRGDLSGESGSFFPKIVSSFSRLRERSFSAPGGELEIVANFEDRRVRLRVATTKG